MKNNFIECYQVNSHYFANCGPSIVASCLRKRKPNTELATENKVDVSINAPSFSEIKIPPKQESEILIGKKEVKPILKVSYNQRMDAFEKPENTVRFSNNQIPPPPTDKEIGEKKGKLRNLSPATLAQMLSAELDHFLKVEQDIAQVAEVQTNVEAARHEHMIQNQIELEDDTAELEELERLDAEIARLEAIYEEKLNEQSYYSTMSYSEVE